MSTYTIDTATSRATPTPAPMKRLTVPKLQGMKGGEPIVMLTAYTARMAQLLDPHCDLLLVGDSLGQVIYGLPSTIPVTLDMMCAHGAAVVRGSWHAVVAVDMPFGSYEQSPEHAFANASRVLKETGAAAVKLEGGEAMAETVAFLVRRGIPVIGHVGLTPQAVNVLGGYRARGRDEAEASKIMADAKAIAEPDDRHRCFGPVRRPGAGDGGHARPVRAHAALREKVRRSCRPHRRGGVDLCVRGARPRLPDRGPDLPREVALSSARPRLYKRRGAAGRAPISRSSSILFGGAGMACMPRHAWRLTDLGHHAD
jgi:hypothetical protein